MKSSEIREVFLSFFEKNKHLKIKGSSLVPKDDPSILFINAGMAPLKDYFLGIKKPPHPTMCNVQSCIRTKDIDSVGDRYHLTYFEMLGSWSIGDYFKERAVELAYDLLVNHFKFDANKLYVSVYKGNPDLNIVEDLVSYETWKKVGVKSDHILKMGEDNFWSAGADGPCGPCTEVYFDTGSEFGKDYDGINFDTGRYIEIWNAGVFMEYNKIGDKLLPLKIKSVDTGSGLERMAMVLNGKRSVYETDLLDFLVNEFIKVYKVDEITARILSDHLRAVSCILNEDISPSNEGRGYIPRKLIRRMVTPLVGKSIDFSSFTQLLYERMPNLNLKLINEYMTKEIQEFLPVISRGVEMLESTGSNSVSGKVIFDLVTSYGVPLDIIKDYASSHGKVLDLEGYQEHYKKHQEISRGEKVMYSDLNLPATKFLGYQTTKATGKIIKYFDNFLVTDQTPFYGESGGEIGDSGTIEIKGIQLEISDTKKMGDVFLHKVEGLFEFKEGDDVLLTVDKSRQDALRRAHSAAHLLHASLRKILGSGATQSGSLIRPDFLRFDYASEVLPDGETLKKIELMVNDLILKGLVNDTSEVELARALELGATALFSEKYKDKVRLVRFDDASIELCGGLHVTNTALIGSFTITSSETIAKGVRRIEGFTGLRAVEKVIASNNIIKELTKLLSCKDVDIVQRVIAASKKDKEKEVFLELKGEESLELNGNKFVIKEFLGGLDKLKEEGDRLINQHDVVIIISPTKNYLVLLWSRKFAANKLLNDILQGIGKGGGSSRFAQGGTKEQLTIKYLIDRINNLKLE